jgi:hypothetical protein
LSKKSRKKDTFSLGVSHALALMGTAHTGWTRSRASRVLHAPARYTKEKDSSPITFLGKRTDPNPPLAPPGGEIGSNKNPILKINALANLDSHMKTFVKGNAVNFQIPSET